MAVARLDAAGEQPVHLVYRAHADPVPLGEAAADTLCGIIAQSFPSAVIEEAHGLHEGARRPVLIVRIRTDVTAGIVALAQRICLAFQRRFVGIEVGGRYLPIHADDTA